jgi:hypothetical protein
MPASGGEPVKITRNTGDLPEESPDGKFLYYMKGDRYPEQCSVWRIPAEGGEETKVLDSTSCLGPFAVGKQGIYFITPSDSQGRDINFYNVSTGEIRQILRVEQAMYIAISPDNRTLLYTQADHSGSDLMLVENFR